MSIRGRFAAPRGKQRLTWSNQRKQRSRLISVEEDPPDLATLTWDALATAATARPA